MLFAFTEALSSIRDFMEQGGNVLWLIALLVFFMWGMIFERIWYHILSKIMPHIKNTSSAINQRTFPPCSIKSLMDDRASVNANSIN